MLDRYHPLSHPDPAPIRTTGLSVDVATRLRLLSEVVARWKSGGGIIYDLDDIPDAIPTVDDVSLRELGIVDDAMFIHFGEDAALPLAGSPGLSVDGAYVTRQAYEGRDGVFVTLVTSCLEPENLTANDRACIASGWIDDSQSVDEGLVHLGFFGDARIVNDRNMFDVEIFLGQALARVGEYSRAASAAQTPHFS